LCLEIFAFRRFFSEPIEEFQMPIFGDRIAAS
jgi:hypothetical protein